MAATDVVSAWFHAHRRGDLDRARALLAREAHVVVPGDVLVGFDALMEWYEARRAGEGPDFSYHVDDLLGGDDRVVALITLRNSGRAWSQVAVYRVTAGVITGIWLLESDVLFAW